MVDVPLGLYLGWVSVAAIANVAAAGAAGIEGFGPGDGAWAGAVALLAAAALAVALAFGALSMITLHVTRGGGGIGSAYVLAAGFGLVFLGVFYAGGLWLGQRIDAGRRRAR